VTRTEALILLAKAPVPGQVKTRLCPPYTKPEAAALYACLLEDTAAELGRLKRVHRYLFFSPPGSGGRFRRDPFSSYEPLPQSGEDLGERMANAFETAFARGFAGVVLVGADCPVLSAPLVRAAFRELASSAGAVFGPSDDGGFYLIALPSPAPSLFRDVHWGTGSVLSEVCLQCRAAGIPYALLPPGFDIDTADDVTALARWARGHSSPACPRTRQWLTSSGEGRASAPSPGPRSRSAGRSP
jgi:rSAM/selenodomain-associated transferase 1